MKITLHKEIRIDGQWEHLDRIQLDVPREWWVTIHKEANTFGHRYSKVTTMDMFFHEPESPIHYWNRKALLRLNTTMGETAFNRAFGFWPWDNITVFSEPEDVRNLVSNFGITEVRMIGWVN